jgi:hypothetical protein
MTVSWIPIAYQFTLGLQEVVNFSIFILTYLDGNYTSLALSSNPRVLSKKS